ncbi:hypothetical protein KRR55_03250 [Paeniglutamicibacter sp. ABSL32-1]|uniref:hypothetical protein n=1 Tax=Paeniglutamicibacter quisquiliarum TaxID=2849498 RepID=UPI001C2D70E1|nr:hypothetical protein [Paeniglutamicibacter quisquiliarum]MBV1778130.1 hypothetical protein [Paeniglutamicibacter quisquiliarum]
MKRKALPIAGGLLACLLGACTVLVPDPDPVESTLPTPDRLAELPADCPRSGGVAEPEGIGPGTEAQIAADLLAAVGDWVNAGTAMVANEPDWIGPGLPGHCLADLAELLGRIHGPALLAQGGDETLSAFQAELVKENLENLEAARAQGGATNARRELALLQQSSQSESGAFLNLIVRKLENRSIQPAGTEEWMAIVVPQGSRNLVFHLETKEAAHGYFSW